MLKNIVLYPLVGSDSFMQFAMLYGIHSSFDPIRHYLHSLEHVFCLKSVTVVLLFILKMAGLFHGVELFIERILKIFMEKVNVKTAAETEFI